MSGVSERAHMTMIYQGKVFVFSDLAAEKAEQILHLAEHNETSPEIYNQLNHKPSHTNSKQLNSSLSNPNFMEDANDGSNFNMDDDDMTCALLIARRNSLYRFLEKRLDRCVGQEQYQNSEVHLAAMSEAQGESKWWLGLALHKPSQ